MSDKFLRLPQVAEKVGLRRTAIYDLMKKGDFPQAVKIGSMTVWLESEVDGWLPAKATHVPNPATQHRLEVQKASEVITGRSLRSERMIAAKAMSNSGSTPASGVYFLVKDDRVVYVGQSGNVYARIAAHQSSKDFDGWCYTPCEGKKQLDILESLYIHYLQPEQNGRVTGTDQISVPVDLHSILRLVGQEASHESS